MLKTTKFVLLWVINDYFSILDIYGIYCKTYFYIRNSSNSIMTSNMFYNNINNNNEVFIFLVNFVFYIKCILRHLLINLLTLLGASKEDPSQLSLVKMTHIKTRNHENISLVYPEKNCTNYHAT